MEVATVQQSTSADPSAAGMEGSMDIDMDIDLGPLPDVEVMVAVSYCSNFTIAFGKYVNPWNYEL